MQISDHPRSSAFPKLPRRFPGRKFILFSALPVQMIGQAALTRLQPQTRKFLYANRLAQILTT
jgi:hypothetical protein